MTCLFPLTPSQFPFNRLPDELGTAFALLQNRVDPVQRPLGESGRGALVVDLLPTHAHKINDISYVDKAKIGDIIYPRNEGSEPMRYSVGMADAGKHMGFWVVVDTRTGALAIDYGFATRAEAEFNAMFKC